MSQDTLWEFWGVVSLIDSLYVYGMNNQQTTSAWKLKVWMFINKSSAVYDVIQPILGLISCTGVTG